MFEFREKIAKKIQDLLENHYNMSGCERLYRLASLQSEILGLNNDEEMTRRIKFLCYELESQIHESMSELERAEGLRKFLFEQQGFSTSQNGCERPENLILSSVLKGRVAHPVVTSLLFTELANHCDLNIVYAKIGDNYLSKVRVNGQGKYLDPRQPEKYMECDEFIRLLESNQCVVDEFRFLSIVELLLEWLNLHCRTFSGQIDSLQMVLICDCFLTLAPQNTRFLAKRGRLLYECGLEKQAWLDMKRFFLLCDPTKAPEDLVEIYHSLRKTFDVTPVSLTSLQ